MKKKVVTQKELVGDNVDVKRNKYLYPIVTLNANLNE